MFLNSSKLLSVASVLAISILTGCSSINAGLQAGELPPNGTFIAENGLHFNIQPLNLATLPPKQAAIPNSNLAQLIRSSGRAEYRIAEGDILSIVLTGYPNITPLAASDSSNPYVSGFPVDQQGFVQFPLVGRIKASGMSVPQFTANLQKQLQRYLKYSDPQVKIVNYRGNKFFIDGEVKQPGEFPINDAPVSLYSAISMAGGATPTGDSNNIVFNRRGISYNIGLQSLRELGTSANQIYLQDGDSIHVNSQDRNKIYVVRDNLNTRTTDIYYVDMQTITSFALANRFEMHPNDIVYVDPTGLTRWNRVISAILPSTSAISILSGL